MPANNRLEQVKTTSKELTKVAIALLAKRDHSVAELKTKLLKKKTADGQLVEQVIASLTEQGFQSDKKFAEAFVSYRSRTWGQSKILRELANRGVDEDTAITALGKVLANQDEETRALAILAKKFALPATNQKTKQKHWRFLQMRGFSTTAIKNALRDYAQSEEQQ